MTTRLISAILQQGGDAGRNLDVEARDADFTLLARGKLGEIFPQLKPGSLLTFLVPGEARFTIKTEPNSDLQAVEAQALQRLQGVARREESRSAAAAQRSPVLERAVARRRRGNVALESMAAGAGGATDSVGAQGAVATVRLFSGNPLRDTNLQSKTVSQSEFANGSLALDRDPNLRVIQLSQPGSEGLNVVIPPDTAGEVEIKALPARTGPARQVLKVHFVDPDAEQLVSLRSHGYYDQLSASAATASDDRVLQLLRDNYGAGLAYCYARLRATDTHGLEKILDTSGPFSDRADIHALRGEIKARNGDHEHAIGELAAGLDAGLPCFTAGLTILIDRVGFYSMSTEEGGKDPLADSISALRSKHGTAIARLRAFAHYCDLSEPILQFSGSDPARPGDSPVRGATSHPEGSTTEVKMADQTITITTAQQQQLQDALKKVQAQGAMDTFCTSWPAAKAVLDQLKGVLALVPGVSIFAGAAITIVSAAGDAAFAALCKKP